jgi:hypothetical protein
MARLVGHSEGEEKSHSWAAPADPDEIPGLLMRTRDEMSQYQIKDPRSGFLSGSSDDLLDSYDARKLRITRHSEWGQRRKTPFISFTSSHKEIVEDRVPHFQERQKDKKILDNTKLTLINTRARLAAGLPILRMKMELKHYKVINRYGDPFKPDYQGKSFYEHDYLMLFRVPQEQIVRTWAWRDIEAWMTRTGRGFDGWFHSVGIPAFQEHERVRLGGTPASCKVGCDCCGQ